jgi:hypothetical protein
MSSIFKEIGQGIIDLSELNVQTFSGNLQSVVADGTSASVINWEKLISEAKSSGTVNLVASTKIELDGDSNTFYESGITQDMTTAHNAAVKAAHDYRLGLINLFKKEINSIVEPTAGKTGS